MIGVANDIWGPALRAGAGAAAYAPYPAPPGLFWDFVTYLGERVTHFNEPVVDLVRIA